MANRTTLFPSKYEFHAPEKLGQFSKEPLFFDTPNRMVENEIVMLVKHI
jgi:hypothetical protein